MSELVNPKTEAVALQVRYVANIGEGRQLEMITAIAQDVSAADLDVLLDKVARAQDRQVLYYEVQEKKRRLTGLLDIIRRAERQTTTIIEVARERWAQSGRGGEWSDDKLSGQEKNERMKFERSMEDARTNARELQSEIEELEQRVMRPAA